MSQATASAARRSARAQKSVRKSSKPSRVKVRAKSATAQAPARKPPKLRSVYAAVKSILVARGWQIDPNPVETIQEEPLEFIRPLTGERCRWLDALEIQFYDLEPV